MKDSWDIVYALAILIGITLLLIYGAAFSYQVATGEKACLVAGYRDASITWDLTVYCITRSEQTDIVKPLSEVRK